VRPISVVKTLAASSSNNICLSQTLLSAGDLVLNGAAVSGGVATLDTQRQVRITSVSSDESGKTFTIYGTDDSGVAISESVAGPTAGGTRDTTLNFRTVTRIAVSAALAANVTVGTNGVGASMPVPIDQYISPTDVSLATVVSGTVNYTVQYTYDNIWTPGSPPSVWRDITALAAQTTNKDAIITGPVRAVRTLINSSTPPGAVTLQVMQAGGHGVS
jgi:hypothetical protein